MDSPAPRRARHPLRRAATVIAAAAVVVAWIAAAAYCHIAAPGTPNADTGSLVPADAAALRAERASIADFGFPLVSRTLVVQHVAGGLSLADQARVVATAADALGGGVPGVKFALPVLNPRPIGSSIPPAAAVTYLFLDQDISTDAQQAATARYVDELGGPSAGVVGITGAVPARERQVDEIHARLPWVELASIVVIGLVIGIAFGSPIAPLVVLSAAGVAYEVSVWLIAWAAARTGISAPSELEPLVVVLLLGVVTDYCIFLMVGMRRRLAGGAGGAASAVASVRDFGPVIAVAALTVASGTAALLAARLQFIRALGPGMAFSVMVGLAVCLTFVPAVLSLLGTFAFWPRRPDSPSIAGGVPGDAQAGRGWRTRLSASLSRRLVAAPVALACLALLGVCAFGMTRIDLGFSVITGLPNDTEPARAAQVADREFSPGIIAPTTVLVEGSDLRDERAAIGRLGGMIDHRPGISAVIGPGDVPSARPLGALLSRDGRAARLLVVLDDDPYAGPAVRRIRALQDDLPAMARAAGLRDVRFQMAGDTALAGETIDLMLGDLVRVAVVVLLLDLVILIVFLRAAVAPLYLLALSALSVMASLGLVGWLLDTLRGGGEMTYYVPFAAAVLLVSLGSDYNVFLVGRIWQDAGREDLRRAITTGASRAGRIISTAGVALAMSFALLAIVPLASFRTFASVMVIGILLDTFVVRALLVPAVIGLVGTLSGWPGSRLRRFARRRRTSRDPDPG
jgi:RND superfamily putative drug exporter